MLWRGGNVLSRDVCFCLPPPPSLDLSCPSARQLLCAIIYHCTVSHFLYIRPQKFASIYCLSLYCITLSAPLILPASVFLSLTLLTNSLWLPLKSWLLWLEAVCDKGLQVKAGPQEHPATQFEWPSPRRLSLQLIGCPLSQWETWLLGQVDKWRGWL